jgi:hypothetical protein
MPACESTYDGGPMGDPQRQLQHEQEHAHHQHVDDHVVHEAVGETKQYKTEGPLPAVAPDHADTAKPTASELAYDAQPQLLKDFAQKFPGAAKLIAASPKALAFVKQADATGAKFGGFAQEAEDGTAVAYTTVHEVFIPEAHASDPLRSMADFLFELNNASRYDQFKAVRKKAVDGKVDAKTFARETTAIEVDGMLALGELWAETKKSAKKDKDKKWGAYDADFYLQNYKDVKAGKFTKEDLLDAVLHTPYSEGPNKGRTPEDVYMEEYKGHAEIGEAQRR